MQSWAESSMLKIPFSLNANQLRKEHAMMTTEERKNRLDARKMYKKLVEQAAHGDHWAQSAIERITREAKGNAYIGYGVSYLQSLFLKGGN